MRVGAALERALLHAAGDRKLLGRRIPAQHEAEDDALRHHLLLAQRPLRRGQLGVVPHPVG